MDFPDDCEKPRLCMLKIWENFAGYGFNLHAEKGKAGQFIGKVDPNSPASFGGLKPNDILIEVNGINVGSSLAVDLMLQTMSTLSVGIGRDHVHDHKNM